MEIVFTKRQEGHEKAQRTRGQDTVMSQRIETVVVLSALSWRMLELGG